MLSLNEGIKMVKVSKSLTPQQASELRTAIYAAFPALSGNVQIITACGRVQVSGIRGYQFDTETATALTTLIRNFGSEADSQVTYADMVVVSGYKAPSKRSLSLRGR